MIAPVKVAPLLALAKNWRRLLNSAASEEQIKALRRTRKNRPSLGRRRFPAGA